MKYDHPTAFSLWDEAEHTAIARVIRSGQFTMGPEVEANTAYVGVSEIPFRDALNTPPLPPCIEARDTRALCLYGLVFTFLFSLVAIASSVYSIHTNQSM